MGQCGCGDFSPDFKFEGPGNDTYVFQCYPSCDYCGTPAGIILYRMGPEDCKIWGVEHLPEIKIGDIGNLFGVVDPVVLQGKLNAILPDDGNFEGAEPDYRSAFLDSVHTEFGELAEMVKRESD